MNVQEVLPRDAIESIDDPVFGTDYFGDPGDRVVVEGDPPRAYPVRILSYHEIVNDVVPGVSGLDETTMSGTPDGDGDGHPIAVTWCPICASAVVYDRAVDGRVLTFGVSGKLADDALVLYDRETESEWKQSSGECIAGEFDGRRLTALPAPMLTWERFREEHPGGETLQPVRGRDSGLAPAEVYDMTRYEQYFDGGPFGLYGMRGEGQPREWDRDDLDPKTVVLGVEHGGAAVGYPAPRVVAAGGVVTDTVGGLSVVVFYADGELHAFENPGYAFEPATAAGRGDGPENGDDSDGSVAGDESRGSDSGRFRADGTTWEGATGRADDGRRLRRLPARRLFAFAWQDDHGPGAFWEG